MDDRFLLALLTTVIVETGVLIAALYFVTPERRPSFQRILFAGGLASSWSLPYLWFLVPRWVSGPAYLPVGESLVILGEAVVFRFVLELRYAQCLTLSALCNLSSMGAGVVLVRVLS